MLLPVLMVLTICGAWSLELDDAPEAFEFELENGVPTFKRSALPMMKKFAHFDAPGKRSPLPMMKRDGLPMMKREYGAAVADEFPLIWTLPSGLPMKRGAYGRNRGGAFRFQPQLAGSRWNQLHYRFGLGKRGDEAADDSFDLDYVDLPAGIGRLGKRDPLPMMKRGSLDAKRKSRLCYWSPVSCF